MKPIRMWWRRQEAGTQVMLILATVSVSAPPLAAVFELWTKFCLAHIAGKL